MSDDEDYEDCGTKEQSHKEMSQEELQKLRELEQKIASEKTKQYVR